MKRLLVMGMVVVALLAISSVVWATVGVMLDSVDFGSAGTEDGRTMEGWGRSATDETGGGYGGIGPGGCRLIWESEAHGDGDRAATILLHPERGAAMGLTLRHLDGFADDSFDIYVEHANGAWVHAGHYSGPPRSETWVVSSYDLSGIDFGRGKDFRVKLEATGENWTGWATWGQVCIDKIELYGNGGPR